LPHQNMEEQEGIVPRIPRRRPPEPQVPNDLSSLLTCPVCGLTNLAGVLIDDGKWAQCSECRLCIPNTPTARKMIEAFTAAHQK